MKAIDSDTRIKTITRKIVVEGIRPIMFDRYAGDNNTQLPWEKKIYLVPGTNVLALPTANVFSFYTAHNTNSAPKRLLDKRKYKDVCNAIQSFMILSAIDDGEFIPFTRNGKQIEVGNFKPDHDPTSGLTLHRTVARLDKGVPNPKERPMLPLPWSLAWKMTLIANDAVKEEMIRDLTERGGLAIGFGTYRGVYGKFQIKEWCKG